MWLGKKEKLKQMGDSKEQIRVNDIRDAKSFKKIYLRLIFVIPYSEARVQ